jgi:hypothetical protein
MKKFTLAAIAFTVFMTLGTAHAAIIPIDLNDFFADPTVSVSLDGSSATFVEDPPFFEVWLSNDPFLGDPEVIIAGIGTLLCFEFDFAEGTAGDSDEFGAYVIDPGTGFSMGPAFEFFTDTTSSGTVSFDLSSLDGIPGLGLHFQLSSLFDDNNIESTLTVSNVRLQTDTGNPIPEPATMTLLGAGLAMLAVKRRKG